MWLHFAILAVLLFGFYYFGQKRFTAEFVGLYTPVRRKQTERIYFAIIVGVLFLLTALRGETIGNDTESYRGIFNNIGVGSITFNILQEPVFFVLNYLIYQLCGEPQVLIIVTAAISYLCFIVFINKQSESPPFTWLIFYCIMYSILLNIIRQGLAMGILLFAYRALRDKKYFKSVLLTLLAMSFQFTAIVFFAAIVSSKFKLSKSKALIISGACAVITGGNLLRAVVGLLFPQYVGYFDTYEGGFLGVAMQLLIQAAVFIVIYNVVSKKDKRDFSDNLNLNIAFFGVIVYIFAFSLNQIARMANYFTVFNLLFLPKYIRELPHHKKIYAVSFVIIYVGWSTLILYLRSEWNYIFPYSFFWGNS